MKSTAALNALGMMCREDINNNTSTLILLERVVNVCIPLLDLADFIIYTLGETNDTLIQTSAFGYKQNETHNTIDNPMKLRFGEGIVGSAALSSRHELIKDTRFDKRYIIDEVHNKSELSVPIIWKNKLLGVLDSEHPEIDFYNQNHINIFYLIASILGAKLYDSLKREKRITNNNKYYSQFIELLEEKELYKNEFLSLQTIADILHINRCYLSRIINEASDVSFTEIVNNYRVKAVIQSLKTKENRKRIMTIAYEAGFNSKARFYSTFKKYTGLTPSIYIKDGFHNVVF